MRGRLLTLALMALAAAAPASAQERLVVYTYESFIAEWGPGPAVKQAFEAECDCTLEWVGVQDGVALLTRLKLEGEGASADVVLGLDQNLIAEARQTGLFALHETPTDAIDVPIEWTDDTFLPFDYGHFAVVYDTESVSEPPGSLEELVGGDSTQKIVLQDPRTSTPGLGFLLWMKAVYGEEADAAWERLRPRVLTVTPGWSEAYGLFTQGETPMVLSYTTSPAYHMIEEDTERYAAAEFDEGHYVQVEVAGMLETSQNPDLARQFLAFMTGPGFQDHIPTGNWMFPAGETSEPLPDAFDRLVRPDTTLMLPPEDVAENRRAWIDEWLAAMSR
ncbi:MAG: thiamine ABC transporter substrate binding subunit [Hyphomicrobiales bacterium]